MGSASSAVRFWSARGEVDWRSLLKTASLLAVVIGIATASLDLLSWSFRYPDWLIPDARPLGAAALASASSRPSSRASG
jgi:hypothetical protein